MAEFKVFLGQAVPQLLTFCTAWLVFELQLIGRSFASEVKGSKTETLPR